MRMLEALTRKALDSSLARSLASRVRQRVEEVAAETVTPGPSQEAERQTDDLDRSLRSLHRRLRTQIRDRWRRTLPFGEQLTDRWEKARFLGFGEGASVYDSALVLGDVAVGEKSWIGPNCVLDGSGGLSIGSNCSISAGCQIYSHDTVAWAVSGGTAPYRYASTQIGDAVYLGPGTVVAAGSRVGSNSIVGALSFVRGDIPPRSFAVGSPTRVIGRVEISPRGDIEIHRTPETVPEPGLAR